MINPVILSGGSGTRLWPMSRTLYPKQLLTLRCRLVGRVVGDKRHGSQRQLDRRQRRRRRHPQLLSTLRGRARRGNRHREDLVVVATADAVMVAPRNRTQEVKKLVARLVEERRDEADALPTVHRPWGSFTALHNGHRVQVKHIVAKPGGKLSLQMHHHRAEHWIIVQGTAKIRRGEEEMILTEDQSTYIPLGTAHRLENPGKIPLHLIEGQSGSYLGEDDIVRFDDSYDRFDRSLSKNSTPPIRVTLGDPV